MLEDCECVECCSKSNNTNADDDDYNNFIKKDLQFTILKICQKFFETIQENKNIFEINLIDKPMKHGDINGTKDFPISMFLDKSICIIQSDSYSRDIKHTISQLQFILSRNEIEKQIMIFLDICYEWYDPYLTQIKKINKLQNESFELNYSLESKKHGDGLLQFKKKFLTDIKDSLSGFKYLYDNQWIKNYNDEEGEDLDDQKVESILVKLILGSDFGVFVVVVGEALIKRDKSEGADSNNGNNNSGTRQQLIIERVKKYKDEFHQRKEKFSVAVIGAELIFDSNGYLINFIDENDENIAGCVARCCYKNIIKQEKFTTSTIPHNQDENFQKKLRVYSNNSSSRSPSPSPSPFHSPSSSNNFFLAFIRVIIGLSLIMLISCAFFCNKKPNNHSICDILVGWYHRQDDINLCNCICNLNCNSG